MHAGFFNFEATSFILTLMTKATNKKTILIAVTATVVAVIAALFILFLPSQKQVNVNSDYLKLALDKIGAPDGLASQGDSGVQSGPLQPDVVTRTYTGEINFESVRDAMVARMKNAGFTNAAWSEKSGGREAGVTASCKDVMIFAEVNALEGKLAVKAEEIFGGLNGDCPTL